MTKVFQADFSDPDHVKSTLLAMTASFVLYCTTYKILRTRIHISAEYEIRLMTFFHGVFSVACALHYVVLPALGFDEGEHIISLRSTNKTRPRIDDRNGPCDSMSMLHLLERVKCDIFTVDKK
jgi:hypothetical protein